MPKKSYVFHAQPNSEVLSPVRVNQDVARFLHEYSIKHFWGNSSDGMRMILQFALERKGDLESFTAWEKERRIKTLS